MNKKKSLLALGIVALGSLAYNLLKPIRSTVPVITDFDRNKFIGKWYELAVLNTGWNKNVKNNQLDFDINEKNILELTNLSQDTVTEAWYSKKFKVYPIKEENEGALKISIFGPIYSGYNIMHIDDDYDYALIFGQDLDQMWILSRNKNIPLEIREKYINFAKESGYATDELIWTIQD